MKPKAGAGPRVPNLPSEVEAVLTAMLPRIRAALEANLVGMYVRGSLAAGGFRPETSDLDLLVVTEEPVGEMEFASLAALHEELRKSADPWGRRIEIAYIDRPGLRRWEAGRRYPTLGQGEVLAWAEHRSNWVLERWVLRERGTTLLGPNPQTLVDPISSHDLRSAARDRLRDWADWAKDPANPDWRLGPAHKAYVVETMCRARYTLARGELPSKEAAVAWALATFPEPWLSIVRRSQSWRQNLAIDSAALVPEVMALVAWAATQSGEEQGIGNREQGQWTVNSEQ